LLAAVVTSVCLASAAAGQAAMPTFDSVGGTSAGAPSVGSIASLLPAETLPAVNQVGPEQGTSTETTLVTIKGENLVLAGVSCPPCVGIEVHFGESVALIVSGSAQELQVEAPPHAAGTVPVSVTTASGTSVVDGEFTYVAPPPRVTVTFPHAGSVMSGSSQTVAGEAEATSSVSVTLYEGPTLGTPLETHAVTPSAGRWSTTFAGLGPGIYTVRAEQLGEAGALGSSQPVTFTVAAQEPPPPPAGGGGGGGGAGPSNPPPVASFTWFPQAPRTNEAVSLVSDSSDAKSPLASFAWSLTGSSVFAPGGPFTTTKFTTAGAHVVRLRVTAADGQSNVDSRTISVITPEPTLMEPFPVVRIAGTDGSFGVKIRLLSVQAPAGAQVTIRCKGHGCPVTFARQIARSSRRGSTTITFSRFERQLPPGVKLVVRVFVAGEIGKYTRFVVRRGKLPKRLDTCLDPAGVNPMACPST
jgi:hypothetical protein